MAYKNQKKNKKHIAKLRADIFGWRSKQRRKNREKSRQKEINHLIARGYSSNMANKLV